MEKILQADYIDMSPIKVELKRIEEFKQNLIETQYNIESIKLPRPEEVSYYDTAQSSLNKLSRFYERYNVAIAGVEQFIISILPLSQIGQSLSSLVEILPDNIGHAIFGDALGSIERGLHPDSFMTFIEKFSDGVGHLSLHAKRMMIMSFEHHDYIAGLMKPINAGLMEAVGLNEAGHNLLNSLHDFGNELVNAADSCSSIGDLASTTDFDITGHIPVITITLSSIREINLLLSEQTDISTAIKNAAIDVASVGVGSALAAKALAAAGFAIGGPLGALGGSILGALGGGILGRLLGNKVKQIPLEKAIKEYERNYDAMKEDIAMKSKTSIGNITTFVAKEEKSFKDSKLLSVPPISHPDELFTKIALILYDSIYKKMLEISTLTSKIRKSIWYSPSKHNTILSECEALSDFISIKLPSPEDIKQDPNQAIGVMIDIGIPVSSYDDKLVKELSKCASELKEMNDKNDSSILMWSYMINKLYQTKLNEIAIYTNNLIDNLNVIMISWKGKMESLLRNINREKAKLGR